MFLRNMLFWLTAFVATTALFCGVILCIDPRGDYLDLPLSVLDRTPFRDFLVPGLILALPVSGTNFIAMFMSITKHPLRYKWSMAAGVMIFGWIAVQLLMIRIFFWPQLLYAGTGIFLVVVSFYLDRKRRQFIHPTLSMFL